MPSHEVCGVSSFYMASLPRSVYESPYKIVYLLLSVGPSSTPLCNVFVALLGQGEISSAKTNQAGVPVL